MDIPEAVYAVVRRIPAGHVATYGQVAGLVEDVAVTPRQVGQIMAVCPQDVPWQRVVGAGGRLAIARRSPVLAAQQRHLLAAEGVVFLEDDRVDMARCQWMPPVEGNGLWDQT